MIKNNGLNDASTNNRIEASACLLFSPEARYGIIKNLKTGVIYKA